MMDWSSCPAVERDSEKVSGSWVFRGTRIPVVALFENLEGGATVSDFLSWFPAVEEAADQDGGARQWREQSPYLLTREDNGHARWAAGALDACDEG
jgi:uncharacterized protein (DUF433 family)